MARLSHCAKSTPPQQADGASNLQRSRAQHIFDMWGIGPCGSRHTIESKLSIVMNVHTSMPAWLVARKQFMQFHFINHFSRLALIFVINILTSMIPLTFSWWNAPPVSFKLVVLTRSVPPNDLLFYNL